MAEQGDHHALNHQFTRRDQVAAYPADDTPEGVIAAFVMAIENKDWDRAYAYLNWWLSGAPGAILARQGYYMSVTEPMRDVLTPAEWAYWYEGTPATTPLPGPDGRISVSIGDRRAGGSYQDRMSAISFWSTIMEESNYLQRKWLEFVA